MYYTTMSLLLLQELRIMLPIFLLLVGSSVSESQENVYLAGEDCFLECVGDSDNSDTYMWTDISKNPPIAIYTVSLGRITKTEEASAIPKYDNFGINNEFPHATTLTITGIEVQDEGEYKCELLVKSSLEKRYDVLVEVAPDYIELAWTSVSECPEPPPADNPSEVQGYCSAIGVYPASTQMYINGEVCSDRDEIPLDGEYNGTYEIRCEFDLFPTVSLPYLECEVEGNTFEEEKEFSFRPPNCELLVDNDQACSEASLTCTCNNAAPAVDVYFFYDDEKQFIGSRQSSSFPNVPIQPNVANTFYCRGCNGVNYGENSFAEITFTCEPPTTSPPTTTTGKGSKVPGGRWLVILAGLVLTGLFSEMGK